MRTGGQVLADGLVAHGSELAFCVPGESYLALLDGLYEHRDAFRIVNCRHEGAAANAADAYGKLTGRPGVCFVTRGPGATHAAAGIHTARQDSTPLLLLVGQVARDGARARVLPGARLRGRVRADGEVGVRDRRPRAHPRGARARLHGGDERAAGAGRARAARGRARRPRPTCPTRRATGRCGRRRRRRRWRSSARCSRRRRAAVRARRRRAVGRAVGGGVHALGAGLRAAGRRDVPPPGRRRQHVPRATPATSASASTRARAADPRLRPAGGGRHAADRDRDAGLHAARAAGRAAAARPRPPRPGRARARLPAGARGAQRRGGVRGRRAGRRRRALGGLDGRRARGLRGVDPRTPRRPATASTSARWSRTCATRCPTTRCSPTAPATSPAGSRASTSGGASARSSGRRAARWATACRPRWRRSSCTRSAR